MLCPERGEENFKAKGERAAFSIAYYRKFALGSRTLPPQKRKTKTNKPNQAIIALN